MNHWKKTIAPYFQNNSAWLLLTVVLASGFVFGQLTGQPKAANILRAVGGLLAVFSPWLVYALWRDWYGDRSKQWWRYLLWPIVFLAYYVVLLTQQIAINDLLGCANLLRTGDPIEAWGVFGVGAVLLNIEGWIVLTKRQSVDFGAWILRWNIGWVGLGALAILTLFILVSNNPFQEQLSVRTNIFSKAIYFLRVYGQALLAYGSYYGLFHLHKHFLYRELLLKKGWLYYLLGAILVLLLTIPIYTFAIGLLPDIKVLWLHPVSVEANLFAEVHFSLGIGVFLASLPLNMWQEWYLRQQRLTDLEKERAATELSLLKQQINPHFFFNTLNNLYAMSITQDEAAPDTILRLSELMRYVIYQGQKELVPLADEIKYLEDFLELQQIRIHQSVDIKFTKNVSNSQQLIPPLLFIILLENAFKHGIEPAPENAFLHIDLQLSGQELTFSCSNSIDPTYEQAHPPGIGLQNLRRRLELRFPAQHELVLSPETDRYTASLTLKLSA